MSQYVWDKKINPETDIKWDILESAPSYKAGQKFCNLCLSEKMQIAKNAGNKMYLNKRTELTQKCRHRTKYKLAEVDGAPHRPDMERKKKTNSPGNNGNNNNTP